MASNNTYSGALDVLLKQIATMMGLADANLPFCQQLMEMVSNEKRSPEIAMQDAGILPRGALPGMDAPGGAGQPDIPMPAPGMGGDMGVPGPAAPPASFMGDGVPGLQTAPTPNPDELRRILSGA